MILFKTYIIDIWMVLKRWSKVIDGAQLPCLWAVMVCVNSSSNSTNRSASLCAYIPWASYQIWKIAGCACAGNAGNVSPRPQFQRKPLVCDPGMHHGTCVTHVPWCMSGSLTCDDGENVPGIPGACAPAILRIWQEAHSLITYVANGISV